MIDTTFDFRTDSHGKDPDSASPTLLKYHRLLWSKQLPSGSDLDLKESPNGYLVAKIGDLTLNLGSDTITNSLSGHRSMEPLVQQVDPELVKKVRNHGSTIGARLVFPSEQLSGGKTINVLRGFHPRIRDRFDLTLECIRRHYLGEPSPLSEPLNRSGNFFTLFRDFDGYIEFFLLQDLVKGAKVQFWTKTDEPFSDRPYPKALEDYKLYCLNTIRFVEMRNQRIAEWVNQSSW